VSCYAPHASRAALAKACGLAAAPGHRAGRRPSLACEGTSVQPTRRQAAAGWKASGRSSTETLPWHHGGHGDTEIRRHGRRSRRVGAWIDSPRKRTKGTKRGIPADDAEGSDSAGGSFARRNSATPAAPVSSGNGPAGVKDAAEESYRPRTWRREAPRPRPQAVLRKLPVGHPCPLCLGNGGMKWTAPSRSRTPGPRARRSAPRVATPAPATTTPISGTIRSSFLPTPCMGTTRGSCSREVGEPLPRSSRRPAWLFAVSRTGGHGRRNALSGDRRAAPSGGWIAATWPPPVDPPRNRTASRLQAGPGDPLSSPYRVVSSASKLFPAPRRQPGP